MVTPKTKVCENSGQLNIAHAHTDQDRLETIQAKAAFDAADRYRKSR